MISVIRIEGQREIETINKLEYEFFKSTKIVASFRSDYDKVIVDNCN